MIISQRQQLTQAFAGEPRIVAAFLLGSAVSGRLRKDSDVDIAILPQPNANFRLADRLELAVRLEDVFKRKVDLGVLDHHNLIYAKEAYLTGRCIYCRNIFQRDLFGATALGLYAELKQTRREIEHAYQTTG